MSKRNQPRTAASRRRRRQLMLDIQGGRCFWCPSKLTFATATLDELVPRSCGGTQRLGNVVVACEPCNQRRGAISASAADIQRAAILVAALTTGEGQK